MEHESRLTVRSYECDSYGHVNNAVYLNYLEYARHVYIHDIGIPLVELRAAGFAILVARVEIDYRRPALTDDELRILTVPIRKGRVGGILSQRIVRCSDDMLVAEAEVTWVCVDAKGRPARLPAAFDKEALSP